MPTIRVTEEARKALRDLRGIGVTYSQVIIALTTGREERLNEGVRK